MGLTVRYARCTGVSEANVARSALDSRQEGFGVSDQGTTSSMGGPRTEVGGRVPQLPVRFGLVGTGGVARLHRPAFTASPEPVELTAVCDVRLEAAQEYAQDLPGPVRVFADHREMAAAGGIDAAIVALPHYLHFPIARDLLDAGIPVLVEKPLTCTLDETRQLRELAAARRVALSVGHMRRFNPDAVWLSRWVRSDPGTFGELHSFDLQSWQNVLGYTRGSEHWILDGKRAGGGVVISLAVHQLDLIRFITGRDFSEVSARGRFDPPFYNGAESSATVQLVMDNGASGVLHASYTAPRVPYSEAMSLFGSHGSIIQRAERIGQYHGPFKYASVTGRETREWGQMYEDFASVPRSEVSELDDNPFVTQLAHLARALHKGVTPVNHVDENFNTMACLQAINDSLRSGRAEPVAAR